uniref:Putative secreted protein n=1 Tax=Amblyomma cajennense TaxID=34607 RepID=A0A023FBP1_AMBCJ
MLLVSAFVWFVICWQELFSLKLCFGVVFGCKALCLKWHLWLNLEFLSNVLHLPVVQKCTLVACVHYLRFCIFAHLTDTLCK